MQYIHIRAPSSPNPALVPRTRAVPATHSKQLCCLRLWLLSSTAAKLRVLSEHRVRAGSSSSWLYRGPTPFVSFTLDEMLQLALST
jgi:hypothetical protein